MRKKPKVPSVEVVNEEEIPAQIIADSILKISEAIKEMNQTRLTRRALVALIAENSKLPKTTIHTVLNNLDGLAETWLK